MRMGTSRFAGLSLLCALLVSAPAAAQGKKSKAKPAAALTESDSGDKGGKEKTSSEPEDAPAAPGGMCISPDAPRTIAECPANMGKAKGKISGAPDSKLRQSKRKVEQPK